MDTMSKKTVSGVFSFLNQINFQKIIIPIIFLLVVSTVFVPIIMAALWSFLDPDVGWSYPQILPKSFSLDQWKYVFKYSDVPKALITSLLAAPITTIVCIILSLPTAYVLGRKNFRGRNLVNLLVILPIIMPSIVVAMSLGKIMNSLYLSQTFIGIIVAHTLAGLPYMIRMLSTAFGSIPQDVIDCAYDLGANSFQVTKEIFIPLIMPGIFAGSIFTLKCSLQEFMLTFIIATPTFQTIPTLLYMYLGYEMRKSQASVVSIILLVPSIIILAITEKFLKGEYLSAGFGKI